ncbi:MAG: phosphotransferase [Prevotellaceae bacterium]|jgi:aminoglycoside/choline kinase family phosphotransferase|nr:phosphotransferase [Prevotellaceae bacterium]
MSEKKLISLYEDYAKSSVSTICCLAQAGSNRQYFRIFGENGKSLIGVAGTSAKENEAFVKIAQQFENQAIPAPKVFAVSADKLCYLQTDLGDATLFDEIKNGRKSGEFSSYEKELLRKTIACLPDIQFKTARKFDFSLCYPQPAFDRRNVFFDLNYFKYNFLKLFGVEFDEIALEKDFEQLAEILLQLSDTETFMYRDFQSRNVMIKNGEPFFIDFQGGRKGAIYYDIASFLWQAKANFSDELREELIDVYLENLQKYATLNSLICRRSMSEAETKACFIKKLRYFVFFRQMQTLGAYGFRGIFEKKTYFLQSIPLALKNVRKMLPFAELPYLTELFSTQITQIERTNADNTNLCKSVESESACLKLTVQIESFSYKKGLPKDNSDNGGGYIFDCRAIYNPGRFDEYKNLTGLDTPVKEFIENSTNIHEFLANVYAIIDKHLEVFLKRGFTHLAVFFGCTGGQHRSVYCAESLAKYLQKYPIEIQLRHREFENAINTI